MSLRRPTEVPALLPKHAFSWESLRNRIIAFLVRIPLSILLFLSYYVKDNKLLLYRKFNVCRERAQIPSREKGRHIAVDIYKPSQGSTITDEKSNTGPVHINWHGSGFVLSCFGADAEMCSILASKLKCTIVDADYRKAPEYPYPAAVEDAEDVCLWVMSHPSRFDSRNISVGGSSAGANLALSSGVKLGPRLCAVTSIAPPTDFRVESRPKKAPERHPQALPPWASRFFDACYLVKACDRSDPQLSPVCASLLQDHLCLSRDGPVYIATGTGDTLYNDGKQCIENLKGQGHQNATFRSVPKEGHGFEKALRNRENAFEVFEEIVHLIKASWVS